MLRMRCLVQGLLMALQNSAAPRRAPAGAGVGRSGLPFRSRVDRPRHVDVRARPEQESGLVLAFVAVTAIALDLSLAPFAKEVMARSPAEPGGEGIQFGFVENDALSDSHSGEVVDLCECCNHAHCSPIRLFS